MWNLFRKFKLCLGFIYIGEGVLLSEVSISRPQNEIPVPISNYINLIRERRYPYYDVIKHILRDMEYHYNKAGSSEVIYTINPRRLQSEIEEKLKSEKLTTTNICRTILAFFYGTNLKKGEDFYVTTTARGRKNYHVRLNSSTLRAFRGFI